MEGVIGGNRIIAAGAQDATGIKGTRGPAVYLMKMPEKRIFHELYFYYVILLR